MTAHSVHPDSHEHGLADGCPRCAEHARDPIRGLDATNLRRLAERCDAKLPPRSENEAEAMARMQDALTQVRYLAGCGVGVLDRTMEARA